MTTKQFYNSWIKENIDDRRVILRQFRDKDDKFMKFAVLDPEEIAQLMDDWLNYYISNLSNSGKQASMTGEQLRDSIISDIKKVCTGCYGTGKDHGDETGKIDCPSCDGTGNSQYGMTMHRLNPSNQFNKKHKEAKDKHKAK